MSNLRPYQAELEAAVFQAWETHRNVLAVLPTGGGKTVLMGSVVRRRRGQPGCAIAHRAELVSQIALALAREGIPHRIIGPTALRRQCASVQLKRLGVSYVSATAPLAVASVQTLVNHADAAWLASVAYWITDEAHHCAPGNMWARAIALFTHPDLQGLGLTATPARADGKPLGATFGAMVQGPTPGDLMSWGYLTRYRIFCPPSDVDYSEVPTGSTGDLSLPKLRAAVHASDTFVGDIVRNWQRIAPGRLTVAFLVDVEAAREQAAAFRAAGVPAEVLTGEADPLVRVQVLADFEARHTQVLCTVDIVSEGFDLPAIECVILGRKTESLPLCLQQVGRALRPMAIPEGLDQAGRLAAIAAGPKPHALIIDHVQNIHRHGLPDSPRVWSLAGRTKRSNGPSDAIPIRVCTQCLSAYERVRTACPYCGAVPEIAQRGAPEFVDGDLYELDPAVLAALLGQRAQIDGACPGGAPGYIRAAHQERIIAQHALRATVALWSGWQLSLGLGQAEQYRLFYHFFGIDLATAQTLGRPDAEKLAQRVQDVLQLNFVQPLESVNA